MNLEVLYKKAYELAYLSLRDPELARSVSRWVMSNLEGEMREQERRKYYKLRRRKADTIRPGDIIDPQRLGRMILERKDALSDHLHRNDLVKPALNWEIERFDRTASSEKNLRERISELLNVPILRRHSLNGIQISRETVEASYPGLLAANYHRNVTTLTDEQTLQLLVYMKTEEYELDEEVAAAVSEEDLIFRYFKYLAKWSLTNSYRASIAFACLVFDYGRSNAKTIHEFLVQDADRERPVTNYSTTKSDLMDRLQTERFANKFRLTKVAPAGAPVDFVRRTPSEGDMEKILGWLRRLSLWRDCIAAGEAPDREALGKNFVFRMRSPEHEHLVEHRRMHAVTCPPCLDHVVRALELGPIRSNLKEPVFEVAVELRPPDSRDRLNAPPLTDGIIDQDLREVQSIRALRRTVSATRLRIDLGGETIGHASPDTQTLGPVRPMRAYPLLLEVFGLMENIPNEISLATRVIFHEFSSIDERLVIDLGGSGSLMFEQTYDGSFGIDWSRNARLPEDARSRSDCLPFEKIREFAEGTAVANPAEHLHLSVCEDCSSWMRDIESRLHTGLSTFIAGGENAAEERHLAECLRCSLLKKSELFARLRRRFEAAIISSEEMLGMLRNGVTGFEYLPPQVHSFAVTPATRVPFFLYTEGKSVGVTIEQTDANNWLVTASSDDVGLEGTLYSVEIVGEIGGMMVDVTLRSFGGRCEGTADVVLPPGMEDGNSHFAVIGMPAISNSDHLEEGR